MAGNRVISAVLTLRDQNFSSNAGRAANSTRDLERRVRSTGNAVSRFGKSATSSFANVAKSALGLAAAYMGINAIKDLGVSMVENAASAQAMSAQFTAVFGEVEAEAKKTVDGLAKSFGMVSERVAPGFTKITSMMKGFGMTSEQSMSAASTAITQAADAAAFYDVAMVDAEGAITSFLKGNTSAAESIGIFATVTGMADFAAKELGKDWKKLDEAGKQIVRLKYIEKMQGAAGATGQAARESEGLENVLGNLRSSWDTLKAKFGVPILGPAVKGMQMLSERIGEVDTDSIINKFKSFGGAVKSAIDTAKPVLNWIKDTAIPGLKNEIVGMYTSSQPGLNWMKDVAFPAVGNAILFVTEKATGMYNFFKDNWPVISPIIAGVAASIAAYKVGVMAVTTATAVWKGVTTAATIAAGILNGTLALTPLGWIVIGIGAVVAAGIALYQNWDKVKEVAASLGVKLKEVWTDIKIGFSNAWSAVKTAAGESVNFMVGKINDLIGFINKIPGVSIPIIPKVEWGETGKVAQSVTGKQNIDSYAVGTNSVKRDMIANIHKGEMIVPARQSQNLRKQGVTIDNIDKPQARQVSNSTNTSGNVFNININGTNKSTTEIINELVPQLKLRMANI